MKQFLLLALIMLLTAGATFAQTETPTVSTSEYVFATVEAGQMTRFDYVASAGSVHIGNLLGLLLFSMWAMFLFGIFVVRRQGQS